MNLHSNIFQSSVDWNPGKVAMAIKVIVFNLDIYQSIKIFSFMSMTRYELRSSFTSLFYIS